MSDSRSDRERLQSIQFLVDDPNGPILVIRGVGGRNARIQFDPDSAYTLLSTLALQFEEWKRRHQN